MTENHAFQIAFEGLQLATVVVGHAGRRNTRDFGHDVFNLRLADGLFALGCRQDALGSTCFVDHINGFVGQMAIIDVFGAQFSCSLQSRHCIFDAVVLFKARFQALQNVHRLLDGGLDHIHFLETTTQGRVFFKDATVLGEGGGPDALELTRAERGFEQIGGVQGAARCRACANQGVNFINEQNTIWLVLE